MLDEALKNVAVIGAAGKMGSGISLLLLQEMARCELEKFGQVGSGEYCLTLIDTNDKGLNSLRKYLRSQILKFAEKNINSLRNAYANNRKLVSNEEVIEAFIEGSLDIVRFDTEIGSAKKAVLVFEAIVENVESKERLYKQLKEERVVDQFYFSNTSSIPISIINDACTLCNRIIGYHFYNPPAIQKLMEIIATENTDPTLLSMSADLAKRLQKKVMRSHDIAGFIGNGHFIREILYACDLLPELIKEHKLSQTKAIYILNKVTQEYLVRTMGIFQLIDYVGLDVCKNILYIMKTYLPDARFYSKLIDQMVAAGKSGGQFPDGSQKDGFFSYNKNEITGIFDLNENKYLHFSKDHFGEDADKFLGEFTHPVISWKKLVNDPNKAGKLQKYLQELFEEHSVGAQIAQKFLRESQKIAENLVKDGVAESIDDVDKVLEFGFFHLYGICCLPLSNHSGARHE